MFQVGQGYLEILKKYKHKFSSVCALVGMWKHQVIVFLPV